MRTTIISVLMIAAIGCGKGDDKKAAGGGGDKATADKPVEKAAAKTVDLKLATTGFTIKVPEGTTTEPGMIPESDAVKFPGAKAVMLVRPRGDDQPLDKRLESAKKGEIQVYKSDVFKDGADTKYAYAYAADQGGTEVVVYSQMFQVDGKDFVCFANADSADHAKALKAACDTVTK